MKKRRSFLMFLILFFVCSISVFCAESIQLLTEAEKSGILIYWDSLTQTGLMEKNGHQISFRAGDNIVLLDNRKLSITDTPAVENGTILVSQKFFDDAESFFKTESNGIPFRVGAILVDPGHGGKDPGAMQTFHENGKSLTVREKDITLVVGKMLYARLKTAYPDKQIILTRNTDKFLSLGERTDIANSVKLKENEAILYVSVHVNASLDKKASGYEVWYLSPGYRRTVIDKSDANNDNVLFPILNGMMEEEYTQESILIAKFIMDGLQAQIGDKTKPRGIKAEEWFVVRNANMPSVLIELGFLTNYAEAQNLNSTVYLQKASLGIYNGISDFIAHFEHSRGFTSSK
ncbi:MAG: N-acetylmuramoyl-L-alanine amidase [Treponema sp.]